MRVPETVEVICTQGTLRFCDTEACTLPVFSQYFHISQCRVCLHRPVQMISTHLSIKKWGIPD